MEQLIIIFHVLAALAVIALVLVQQGKGADMGASFGGGASNTLFGSRGSGNALTRATAILATLFFATSFALAVVARDQAQSAGDVDIPIDISEDEVPNIPAAAVDEIPTVGENAAPSTGDIPSADAAAEFPTVDTTDNSFEAESKAAEISVEQESEQTAPATAGEQQP